MKKIETLEELKAYLKDTGQFLVTFCKEHNIGYDPLKEDCPKCRDREEKEGQKMVSDGIDEMLGDSF